jgi:hypothetical protein
MHAVSVDASKNRLTLKVEGMLSSAEVKEISTEAASATKKLRPGFGCIVVMAGMKTASPEVAEEIARVQAMLRSAGVGQVVRVVASKIAAMQLERTSSGLGYKAGIVETENEAHALLDAG